MSQVKSRNVEEIDKIIFSQCIVTINHMENEYVLQERLGSGYFGVTYRCVDVKDNKPYAIKFEPVERIEQESKNFRAIEAVETCEQLVHFVDSGPVIKIEDTNGQAVENPSYEYQKIVQVNIKELTKMEGAQFALDLMKAQDPAAWNELERIGLLLKEYRKLGGIVMEFISGEDLNRKKNPLSLDSSLKIVKELGKGIAHMHKWGFVHGDLKPENVILKPDGHVKIIDFSTTVREGQHDVIPIATSYYAPAHLHAIGKVDVYSDLYAVAAIFYRLVVGAEPVNQYLYQIKKPKQSFSYPGRYDSSEYVEIKVRVNKYWERMHQLPRRVRQVLARAIRAERELLPGESVVNSEKELESYLRNLPIPEIVTFEPSAINLIQSAAIDNLVEYRPFDTVTEFINDLEQACKSSYEPKRNDRPWERGPLRTSQKPIKRRAKKINESESFPTPTWRDTSQVDFPDTLEGFDSPDSPFSGLHNSPSLQPTVNWLTLEWNDRHTDKSLTKRHTTRAKSKKSSFLSRVLWGVAIAGIIALLYFSRQNALEQERESASSTSTAQSLVQPFIDAENKFNSGYAISQTAENSTDLQEIDRLRRNSIQEYQAALKIYEDLMNRQDFSSDILANVYRNAAIICWDIYVNYYKLGLPDDTLEATTSLEKSFHYLKKAREINQISDDLEDLVKYSYLLTVRYIDISNTDGALSTAEECAEYLSNSNTTQDIRNSFGSALIDDLTKLKNISLTPDQTKRVEDVLTKLGN